MWKRDEAVRPPAVEPTPASQPRQPAAAPAPRLEARPSMEKDVVNIGKSVVIKGELNGSEDLTVEGHVEGTIQLRDHVLTIGPNGRIKAQVFAKAVIAGLRDQTRDLHGEDASMVEAWRLYALYLKRAFTYQDATSSRRARRDW